MSEVQPSVSEYFAKVDEKKSKKQSEKDNPSKRTRSELSSTGSEMNDIVCDSVNARILEQLNEIRNEMVKKEELKQIVQEFVSGKIEDLKKETEEKLKVIKHTYDEKCGKLKAEVDRLHIENENLRQKIQDNSKKIVSLEERVDKSYREVDRVRAKANKNEQYSRKTNIKLHGVANVILDNGKVQDIQTTVRHVLKEAVKVDITPDEITAVHRIPGKGSVTPILLKVKNTEVKARIMHKRKAFRETVIGAKLSDDVTKENGELIRKLFAHEEIEESWYFNCNRFAKLKGSDGRRVKFDINNDIDKKIKKNRSGSRRKSDPSHGYQTESDSDYD